jgi:molybdopterin converting factor small subunit
MSIDIVLSPSLLPMVDYAPSVKVKGATLGQCLESLMQDYPQLKTTLLDENQVLRKDYMVFVNGENAYMEELNRPVKEGDKIHLMSFFVGG